MDKTRNALNKLFLKKLQESLVFFCWCFRCNAEILCPEIQMWTIGFIQTEICSLVIYFLKMWVNWGTIVFSEPPAWRVVLLLLYNNNNNDNNLSSLTVGRLNKSILSHDGLQGRGGLLMKSHPSCRWVRMIHQCSVISHLLMSHQRTFLPHTHSLVLIKQHIL